jgi:hypothetical protein
MVMRSPISGLLSDLAAFTPKYTPRTSTRRQQCVNAEPGVTRVMM